MTGTDNERGRWERHADEREAALDEREAVLDALERSFGQLDEGRAAARAEARQAREQARHVRERAAEVRRASERSRAERHTARWDREHPLGAEFATLADNLVRTTDPSEAVRHIVDAAPQVVPGADLASMTVLNGDGRFRTPARTDQLAVRLDQAQYRANEGPCLDATRQGGLGLAQDDDLAAPETRWHRFSPSAVRLGVRSVVAVGLLPQSTSPRLGALNLYAHDPGAMVEVDVDVAMALAAYLAVALASASHVDAARQEVTNVRQALETRDLIGQAKGIVMADRQVTAERAFELLSAASQRLNIKLRDLAEQVVHRRRS